MKTVDERCVLVWVTVRRSDAADDRFKGRCGYPPSTVERREKSGSRKSFDDDGGRFRIRRVEHGVGRRVRNGRFP